MGSFEILLSETAAGFLSGLPGKERERVRRSLSRLSEGPFLSRPLADIRKLKAKSRDYYRLRVGDYRAIYVVEGRTVKVTEIIRRRGWLD